MELELTPAFPTLIGQLRVPDPEVMNRIIWFSVRGNVPMPAIARLPAFDAMRLGLQEEREEIADRR